MHTIIMTWPRPLWPCQSGGSVTCIAGNSVAEDEIRLQWPCLRYTFIIMYTIPRSSKSVLLHWLWNNVETVLNPAGLQ